MMVLNEQEEIDDVLLSKKQTQREKWESISIKNGIAKRLSNKITNVDDTKKEIKEQINY